MGGLLDLATAPWDEERFDLLGGRLSIALPRGARVEPRTLQGNFPPAGQETRIVLERNAVLLPRPWPKALPMRTDSLEIGTVHRLTVIAHEFADVDWNAPWSDWRRWGRDFEVERFRVSDVVLAIGQPLFDVRLPEDDLVLDVLVGHPDTTTLRIQIRMDPLAHASAAPAAKLAHRVAASLRAGPAKRPKPAARLRQPDPPIEAADTPGAEEPTLLEACADFVQLAIDPIPGFVLVTQATTDGVAHQLRPDLLQHAVLRIEICRSRQHDWPSKTRVEPREISGRVLGRDMAWRSWRPWSGPDPHELHAEHVASFPWADRHDLFIHIHAVASDHWTLDSLMRAAESLRLVPRFPPLREL